MNELERLLKESEGYDSYEVNAASYENLDGPEKAQVDHLVRNGMPYHHAINSVKKPLAKINPGGGGWKTAKAQFDLIVKRNSANILSNLPLALFGSLDALSGYNQVLSGLFKAGVSITNVQYSVFSGYQYKDNLTFTYSDGTNTDTVTITCNQIEYPVFLESIQNDLFEMSKIRYSLSDTTQVSQFDNGMFIKYRTLFGKTGSDQISVGAWKSPQQYQNGIIDMDICVPVNGQTSLVTQINAVSGFSFTISGFVSKYHQGNSAKV